MKKMIAILAMAVSATAFAKGTVPQTIDASVSYVEPCWVKISNTSIVDGRRIAGFSVLGGRVLVYTGTTNDYNSIDVTVGGQTPDAYIADMQARIKKCYQ
jgi:hypothetical protein